MSLVGFLNRSRSFPAPLISVAREDSGFVAVYPSGHKVRLKGVNSEETVRARDSFVPIPKGGVDGIPELAFGVAPEIVLAGDQKGVARVLRTYIAQRGALPLHEDETDAIRAFLISIGEYAGTMSVRELLDVLRGRRRIVARITSRQLRRRKERASTLVVQLTGRGATRTLYRKGIPFGRSPSDVRVPAAAVQFVQRDLFAS